MVRVGRSARFLRSCWPSGVAVLRLHERSRVHEFAKQMCRELADVGEAPVFERKARRCLLVADLRDRIEQRFLAGKVAVDGPDRHAGRGWRPRASRAWRGAPR